MFDHVIGAGGVGEQTRPRTLSGHGVLVRAGELVLLCELPTGRGRQIGALLDTVAALAGEHPDGAELSNRLTSLIDATDPADVPSFCAYGPAGDGLAVVVHGDAELVLGTDGNETRFTGQPGVTVVDRIEAVPAGPVRAVVEGARLHVAAPPPAEAEPAPEAEPATPEQVQRIVDGADEPEQTTPEPTVEDSIPADNLVLGVYCRRGHFNDPVMTYCTVCGITMAQATRHRVLGPRPALGVLVLDDGAMYSLVRDHVFGRDPGTDPAVAAGRAVSVPLRDPSVSRVHARIVLDGWDVRIVDNGSTNGTFVAMPGEPSWTRVVPGADVTLRPGMIVALGRRQLRYHTHRAQSVDFGTLQNRRAQGHSAHA